MTKAQRYRKAFLAMHGRNERKLMRAVQKALRSDIRNLWIGNITDKNYNEVLQGLKLTEFEKVLINFYIEAGTKTGEMVKKDLAKQQKRISPFFSEVWTNFVLSKVSPILATQIVTIKNTLLNDIGKLIAEYISLNLDTTDIANAIYDFVDDPKFYKWQAMRIARTETTTAMNLATNQAGIDSEVLLDKEWISADDGNERPSHAELNGQRVDGNDAFANGLMYPGDPSGDASEVINCRCTFLQIPKRDREGNLIFGL
jgi:uncharacterized protein with gpF-like domain